MKEAAAGQRRRLAPAEVLLVAQSLHADGRLAQAEPAYRHVLAQTPDQPEALSGLGALSMTLHRPQEAEALLGRALKQRPDWAEALYPYGLALAALGRTGEAVSAFERLLALRPDDARAHVESARALGRLERYEEAVGHLERAIGVGPANAEMHNDLGAFLAALGRHEEAVAPFRAAVALNPAYAVAHNNLGNALAAINRYEEAVACYKSAFGLDPAFAEAYANLGSALAELHHPADALPCFDRALALDPTLAQSHHHRGQALVALGDLAGARENFERALALQPDRPEFYNGLAGATRLGRDDPHFLAMQALVAQTPAMNETDRTQLHFALARAYEDQGRPADAFLHLSAGNASRRRRIAYDEAATLERLGRFAPAFDAQRLSLAPPRGSSPDAPIFIVGMPRSGSTLVEQILASHPQVFGAGELMLLGDEVERLVADSADLRQTIEQMDFAALGARYRERLRARAPGAARITDKQLLNFQFLGLIRMALPDARVIHTRRDPVDTCLSCFALTFSAGFAYSNDLGELGRYYRRYADIMAHWRAVLPEGAMLEVSYEDLVADFEPQARRILDHCGLPWDARCLAFHQTQRPVITASAAQVRRPLYQTSSGRARGYGRLLDPLREALGPEDSTA